MSEILRILCLLQGVFCIGMSSVYSWQVLIGWPRFAYKPDPGLIPILLGVGLLLLHAARRSS